MYNEPVEWVCKNCGVYNPDYNEETVICESCGTEFASGDVEYINT